MANITETVSMGSTDFNPWNFNAYTSSTNSINPPTIEDTNDYYLRTEGDFDYQVNPPVGAVTNVMSASTVTTDQSDPQTSKYDEEVYKFMDPSHVATDSYTNVARGLVSSTLDFDVYLAVYDDWHKPMVIVDSIDSTKLTSNTDTTQNVNVAATHSDFPLWYKKPGNTHGLKFSLVAQQTDFTLPVDALGIQYWS